MANNKLRNEIQEMGRHAAKAEAMLKQVANANRLMILCRLVEGEETVGGLTAHVGLAQSAVSQHLIKMKDAGLVISEKRGQQVYYSLASEEVKAILGTLHQIYCSGRKK